MVVKMGVYFLDVSWKTLTLARSVQARSRIVQARSVRGQTLSKLLIMKTDLQGENHVMSQIKYMKQ